MLHCTSLIGSCNNANVWYLFCELHLDNWHVSKLSQWKVRCFEKRARGVPFWTGCIYSTGQSTHKGVVIKIVCKHNCKPLPQEVHINSATIFYSPRRIQECFNCPCSVIHFSEGTMSKSGLKKIPYSSWVSGFCNDQ